MEETVIRSTHSVIELEDLPSILLSNPIIENYPIPPTQIESAVKEPGIKNNDHAVSQKDPLLTEVMNLFGSDLSLKDRTDHYKRSQVAFTLSECEGNQVKAAERLQCDRHTISKYLNLKK